MKHHQTNARSFLIATIAILLLCVSTTTTTTTVVEAFTVSSNNAHTPSSFIKTTRTQIKQHSFDTFSSSYLQPTTFPPLKSKRTKRSTDYSNIQLLSTTNDSNEDESILAKFDLTNAVFLIGGQATLILIAALLSFPLSTPNYGLGSNFAFTPETISIGVLATLPLIAIAFLLDFVEDKVPALRDTTFATYKSVLVVMGSQRKPLLALIVASALGIVAGFGEEMLFRGVLQSYLLDATSQNVWASVGVSSVLFGLLHLATPLYAFIAMLASSYFGYLFLLSGGTNLAVPVICHGLYDIWALCWAHYVITGMSKEELMDVWTWDGPGSTSRKNDDNDGGEGGEKVVLADNKTIL